MTTTRLPRIAVIGCGGTISSLAPHGLDTMDYPELGTKMAVGEVIDRFSEARSLAEIEAIPFRAVGSSAFGLREWIELRQLIEGLGAGFDGVVVLHGTATLEETAYVLDLTVRTAIPVVLTGAQKPPNTLGSDAGTNLLGALRVAGDPAAAGLGVLVAFNDEIHCARDVVKTSNYRLQTFKSPEYGPVGHIEGDGVVIDRRPIHRRAPDTALSAIPDLSAMPRVDIVYSYAGADAVMVEAACSAGARGIVSAGLAPGLPAPGERAALEVALASGVRVVQTSRAFSGRIPRRHYLRERGVISGRGLTPQKCRILLGLGLTITDDVDALQELFDTH